MARVRRTLRGRRRRAGQVRGQLQTREQILAECDVVLLPKPEAADVAEMRAGQVLSAPPPAAP